MMGRSLKKILLLCLSLLLLSPLMQANLARAANSPVFSLSSSTDHFTEGEKLTINIHAEQVVDLVAYELTLTFNPDLWDFVEIGSELNGYKAAPLQDLHADGIVTIAFTKLGQTAGENGSLDLGYVTLKAKAPGSGGVRLTEAKLVDSQFVSSHYSPDTELAVTISHAGSGGPPAINEPPIIGEPPINGDNGEANQQVVNEESMKPDGDGKVVVEIAGNKKEVLLPAHSAASSELKAIELKNEGVSLKIDPVVLKALSKLVSSAELENAQVSVKIEQASEEEAEQLVSQGNENNGSTLSVKSAGAIYHFGLSIITKDGTEKTLDVFEQPIDLALPYDEGAAESTLGIYYFNESTKTWDYIGGVVDKASKQIIAKLNHFSTYAVLEYHKAFADMPANHWASEAIEALAAKHIVSGVSESDYAPNDQVSRAEFAALMTRLLGLQAEASAPFADVADNDWYADDVAAAYEAKLIAGKSPSLFAPNDNITREEMAAMLVRAYEYGTGTKAAEDIPSIDDRDSVSAWANTYVNAAVNTGLMSGVGGGKFAPAAFTTRAQAALAIYNLLTKIE